jgi:hypothetical protein
MHPKIKYELHALEQLASGEDIRSRPQQITQIVREIERIKKAFTHEILAIKKEHRLQRYVHHHQQALVRILDKSTAIPGFKEYAKALEDLLHFMEANFPKYFNLDAKAPEGCIARTKKQANINLTRIRHELEKGNADTDLTEIILHAIRKFIQAKSTKNLTFRRIRYIKELQHELLRLVLNPASPLETNTQLRFIMHYLNYNAVKCLAYYARYITMQLHQSETLTDKIQLLSKTLKEVNQMQTKPSVAYNHKAPSLQTQLTTFITEELTHLERLLTLDVKPHPQSITGQLPNFKLKVELSVSQLACLTKLFIETKLVNHTNTSEVLRFLTRFVITRQTHAVSFDSLRGKFYNVETGTKESVKQILISMIHHVDKSIP